MAIDLEKWKQRNAAERVRAALTRPKKDNTAERLRRQFAGAAEKAVKALVAKERNPWLKYGFNEEVVVTARLGKHVIPVTGDEAIALKPKDAEAYLKDVIAATEAGQLDRDLLKTVPAAASNEEPRRPRPSAPPAPAPARETAAPVQEKPVAAPPRMSPISFGIGLRDER
ncbi:MAG TPA: hypothetical protein VIL42_03465 [Sphingomicrobium sp.]|jgi:hypothetical protein